MAVLGQPSPRKVVPLSGGPADLQRTKSEGPSFPPTRRVYYCGVVLEGGLEGHPIAQDVTQLVESLGDIVSPDGDKTGIGRSTSAPNITDSTNTVDSSGGRKRALTGSTVFNDVLNELVTTERSYVSRLRTLKVSYADPLRKFARKKEEAILPAYEAKTLFGNIDAILPANEAFLVDLEQMMTPNGPSTVGGIGDVALKHIRDLRAFDCYKQYYAKREEAQAIVEREMTKKSSTGFAGFIERTKYSTESKNRVGLRELLMEPIQRIPRYTLMFRTMIKHMAADDPQRSKLMEADELASKIALAETDEQTKRATVMYCLERSIEGFPPNLISNNRTLIDTIDIEDVPSDVPGSSYPNINEAGVAGGAAAGPLHCTLFLFDDRLLIVKRPNGSASGRSLSGLDEIDRTIRTSGLPTGIKKGVMSCKGVMEVTDVVATDIGGADFHLFIETPFSDQYSDRWANRPFRSCSVVHPPSPPNYDPGRCRSDKMRFLDNLWNAQAFYRCKDGRSVARLAPERELSGKSLVRTWFNVYQRVDYLKEPKKNKLVVHIDPFGDADPLLFGQEAPPYVIARIQPMAGEVCRYTVTSSDPNDEGEEDIVHTPAVPARIVQTIHQFGLYKFRTGRNSLPSTPTASASGRSRAAMFGLDAISRNLFASTSIRSGEVFGSITSSRRPKSAVSRSSTVNTGTSGMSESSLKSSQRSTSTGGTSFLSVNTEDAEPRRRAESLRPNKLSKRGRSPGGLSGAESGSEMDLDRRSSSSTGRSTQQPPPRKTGRVDSRPAEEDDDEEMVDAALGGDMTMDESEWDLSMRLELARKNSQSQEVGKQPYPVKSAFRRERTISEDINMEESISTSLSMQAQSGSTEFDDAGDASPPQPSIKSHPDSLTPTPSLANPPLRTRSIQSTSSNDRRPMGPRNPAKSPSPSRPVTPSGMQQRPITPIEDYLPVLGSSSLPRPTGSRPTTPTRKNLPPFPSTNHPLPPVPPMPLSHVSQNPTIDELERAVSPTTARRTIFDPDVPKLSSQPSISSSHTSSGAGSSQDPPTAVQPLAIKKKTSVRRSSIPTRKSVASPLESSRHFASQVRKEREAAAHAAAAGTSSDEEVVPISPRKIVPHHSRSDISRLDTLSESTREDLEAGHRAVKRIRLDIQTLKAPSSSRDPLARVRSPVPGIPRSPQSRHIANRAAEARMEEMRQMIQSRTGRPLSTSFPAEPSNPPPPPPPSGPVNEEVVTRLESLATEADKLLERASVHHADLQLEVSSLRDQFEEEFAKSTRLEGEVGRAKRQTDLVKKLLADATAENEIMYEAFNEELDGMFNDASLPDDEAWLAMANDLQKTKEARNELSRENSTLKRRLEEAELQNREWEALLREHGLIP